MDNANIKALFMIVNAGFADELIDLVRESGIRGATILNTRGEGSRHESVLGITVNTEKEMIFCVTDEATAEKAMAVVKEKAGFKTPIHGVCFTMPVNKTVGISLSDPQDDD